MGERSRGTIADSDLLGRVTALRDEVERSRLTLDLSSTRAARDERRELLAQLDDYVLPRLATIDAPHLLVLDEPTNHLDIESREALTEALNDYTGAVVLVSHDMHLLGLVADRLWLVSGGAVTPYADDLETYRRSLLTADEPERPREALLRVPGRRPQPTPGITPDRLRIAI